MSNFSGTTTAGLLVFLLTNVVPLIPAVHLASLRLVHLTLDCLNNFVEDSFCENARHVRKIIFQVIVQFFLAETAAKKFFV